MFIVTQVPHVSVQCILTRDVTEVLIPQGEPEVVIHHGGQGAPGIQGVRGGDEASLFNLPGLC